MRIAPQKRENLRWMVAGDLWLHAACVPSSVKGWTVKKCLLYAGLLLLIVSGTGCVVIDVEKMPFCRLAAAGSSEPLVSPGPTPYHQEWRLTGDSSTDIL